MLRWWLRTKVRIEDARQGGILGCLLFLGLLLVPAGVFALTSLVHSSVAVGTTATTVLSARATRNFLFLVNISDTNMDCSVGKPAVVGEGFRLYASGGAVLLDYETPVASVSCIHGGAGSKTLLVSEGTRL